MPAEKYTREYLERRLPAKIRETVRNDGLSLAQPPTYDYLNANGFCTRSINNALQRHFDQDMTLHQWLRKKSFTGPEQSEWPTNHEETKYYLKKFVQSRRDRHNDRNATLDTIKTALRVALREGHELHGKDGLLQYARCESTEEKLTNYRQLRDLCDRYQSKYNGGTAENYVRYLENFYKYVCIREVVDHNPVKEIRPEYDFDTETAATPRKIPDSEVTRLWNTLRSLPELNQLSEGVKNITKRHGLGKWQVQMMVLLTLGIGVGPRTSEYMRTNCREHWDLENDRIEFPIRKNGPGEVPILVNSDFLAAFIDYMEVANPDWNGKPFPNSDAESGSRTGSTLNNWLRALCREADVRYDDGTYPTLQNLRQYWHNKYKQSLTHENVRLQLVARSAGTSTTGEVKESYATDETMRESIEELMTEHFEGLLPLDELPQEMRRVVDQSRYIDTQSTLDTFD